VWNGAADNGVGRGGGRGRGSQLWGGCGTWEGVVVCRWCGSVVGVFCWGRWRESGGGGMVRVVGVGDGVGVAVGDAVGHWDGRWA
jgi:hypothetical protein